MKYRIKLYERVYRLLPKKYREWVKNYLIYSNFTITPEMYVGFSILYGISLSFASFFLFLFRLISFNLVLPVFVGIFVLFQVFMQALLFVVTDSRTKVIEEILPDFLRLLSANLRSGLIVDEALLVSARPEFGPLEKEIKFAAKETLSGGTVEGALDKMANRFDSRILRRCVDLLTEGIRRGGDLPRLLDSLGDDIRQVKILRRDVSAIVMVYVIFIFFAAGIGAPLLYAISGFLVNTMTKLGTAVSVEESLGAVGGAKVPIRVFQMAEIKPEFLEMYSILSMLVTCVFGSLLIGLVQQGSERAGLKLIPVLLIVSLAVYFISKGVVASMFGTTLL